MADRLVREQSPPPGYPQSPVPQYWNPVTGQWERVYGQHNAPYQTLVGSNGQPISSGNRLPVDVSGSVGIAGQVATDIGQIRVENGRLYGYNGSDWVPVRVNSNGQLELAQEITIDNVTVNVGSQVELDPTKPNPVTLSGNNVLLANGNFINRYFETPPSDGKAVLIALNGSGGGDDCILTFQHDVDGLGWVDWLDGEGRKIEVAIKDDIKAVFGPFQGFPKYNGGRLFIASGGTEINISKTGQGSIYSSDPAHQTSYPPANAFNESIGDGSANDPDNVTRIPATNGYLQISLTEPKVVNKLRMWGRNGLSSMKDFSLKGSNDGNSWDSLVTGKLQNNDSYQEWDFDNQQDYIMYRIEFTSNHGAIDLTVFHDIRLLGLAPIPLSCSIQRVG